MFHGFDRNLMRRTEIFLLFPVGRAVEVFCLFHRITVFEIYRTTCIFQVFEYPRDSFLIPYLRAIPYL